jgi:glucose-1-phosphate cytidylyltransferase
VRVLLLCGGRGVIDPETRNRIPKCLLKIGNRPLIWHVMKLFAAHGHTDFVLALGQGGDQIKSYFMNAFEFLHDIELNLSSNDIKSLNKIPEENWTIKLVDTGTTARTGARISRCERYLRYEPFFISYTDILADVKLDQLLEKHVHSGKMLTVTGVNPPSRFGTFYQEGEKVSGYNPTAMLDMKNARINGGFMVANEALFQVLSPITECNLETEIFESLTQKGDLNLYSHDGFWQNVDTERDQDYLNHLYDANKRPWLGIY